MSEQVSIVKACNQYFGPDRKIEISEFKALTDKDRNDLRDMLIEEGYNVSPIIPRKSE